jgi:UDP-glucose-4-epimerase GalE
VTGGAGYIGSHVVAALVEQGHEPLVYDDLSSGYREAIAEVPIVVGDVRDADRLANALSDHQADAAIHLAGRKSPAESLERPGLYFDVNVNGSRVLLDALADAGIEVFVFSSSCAVYGIPERLPVDEASDIRPTTPYGESKALVERMLRWYAPRGVRSATLRYFNAAGASPDGRIGENWDDAINLIPVVLKATLGGGAPVEVFGTDYPTPDGTAIRDYVHVVDLADAHVTAMESLASGAGSLVTNLGTGTGSSVAEVIREVERATGRDVPRRMTARRPGDAPAVWADVRRASTDLGWVARHDLRDIIESAVRWHETHPSGFRGVPARP